MNKYVKNHDVVYVKNHDVEYYADCEKQRSIQF